jgi:hypothetical protein
MVRAGGLVTYLERKLAAMRAMPPGLDQAT